MTKRLSNLDLQKNELQNARIQNLGTAPGSPVGGQVYFDTSTSPGKLYWYDGVSAWVLATGTGGGVTYGSPSASAVGDASADGVATTVTRSDHKHAREAFGAVTAQTAFAASSANGVATTLARSDHAHGTPTHDAAAHSAIKISDLAAPTATVSFGSQVISNVAAPSAGTDAANKTYVDGVAQGLDFKASVRVATTAAGTLASSFENTDVIDGITLATGDRILIKNQAAAAENGIYTVNASGAPTRSTDSDASGELSGGSLVYVESGTTQGTTQWVVASTTATPWVPGSSGSTWSQFSGASTATAGAGLTATGNVFAVGAGTGITVAADSVAVDTTTVARWLVLTTTGGATSEVLTHSLGNQYPLIQVASGSTPWDVQDLDIEKTSTTTLTLRATANLPAGLKVTVIG